MSYYFKRIIFSILLSYFLHSSVLNFSGCFVGDFLFFFGLGGEVTYLFFYSIVSLAITLKYSKEKPLWNYGERKLRSGWNFGKIIRFGKINILSMFWLLLVIKFVYTYLWLYIFTICIILVIIGNQIIFNCTRKRQTIQKKKFHSETFSHAI